MKIHENFYNSYNNLKKNIKIIQQNFLYYYLNIGGENILDVKRYYYGVRKLMMMKFGQ